METDPVSSGTGRDFGENYDSLALHESENKLRTVDVDKGITETVRQRQVRPVSSTSSSEPYSGNVGSSSTTERELTLLPPHHSNSNDILNEDILKELRSLPPAQINPLSFSKKVAIASGHILNDLCASLWFSYLLLYFQKVVEFDKSSSNNGSRFAAGLMFLGQIVDGLATPLVGYEADQEINFILCSRSYGRCKSWHLTGVVLVVISFPFVFAPCIGCTSDSSDWAKIIYYSPFIVIFQIGWASTQISHLALIPKMHPDEMVRTELLAMRYSFTVFANILIFLMTWFTLGNNEKCKITPDDASSFMKIAVIAVGIGTFFTLLFHIYVKEESDHKVKEKVAILSHRKELIRRLSQVEAEMTQSSLPNYSSAVEVEPSRTRSKSLCTTGVMQGDGLTPISESISDEESPLLLSQDIPESLQIRPVTHLEEPLDLTNNGGMINKFSTRHLSLGKEHMSMKDWLTLPQFYLVAFIYLSTRLSMNLSQVYVPLYLEDSLRLPCRTVATVPLTMYISGFTVSLFIKVINKHLGRQLAYIFGTMLLTAGSLLIFLLNWEGSLFLKEYVIYCVAALLGGGASAILVTSLSITADLIGNNVENGAFVYGAMSFCDKFSCGIAVLLISSLVPCSDEENKSVESDPCDKMDNIPFYRNVLTYSAGGCALLGVIGIILLTLRIHIKQSQRNGNQRG